MRKKTKAELDLGDLCILAEGPAWADAEFYGQWLLAAARAEALWQGALQDPAFEKKVSRLTCSYMPDFGISATLLISRLGKEFVSISIPMADEGMVEAAMMVGMGFFIRIGEHYRMAIPHGLNMDTVKACAVKLAKTEDAQCWLHPERLLTTITKEKASREQSRLRQNHS